MLIKFKVQRKFFVRVVWCIHLWVAEKFFQTCATKMLSEHQYQQLAPMAEAPTSGPIIVLFDQFLKFTLRKKACYLIKIMYWIIASVEGFDLLMPFQSDNKCLRAMTKISLELKCLQTEFYEGAGELKESLALESLMTSLRRFNNTYLS